MGTGERRRGANVQRPELWDVLQSGQNLHNVLEAVRPGLDQDRVWTQPTEGPPRPELDQDRVWTEPTKGPPRLAGWIFKPHTGVRVGVGVTI